MEIDRSKIYTMPLICGPLWDQAKRHKHLYQHVEMIYLEYETEPEAIPPLLPAPYKPGKTPIVSVTFIENNGVDFMVGGGYRLANVCVAAQFDGAAGHIEGSYVLVMPESNGLPIVLGREWLGMPKFHTDITSIRVMDDGHLRAEVSIYGHLLFGLDLAPPFKKQNFIIRKAVNAEATRTPNFGYKYVASFDGPPDADYPTIMWNDYDITELWLGKNGEFYVENPNEREIGYYAPVMRALRTLPMLRILRAAHGRGSVVLRNDKNGRLR